MRAELVERVRTGELHPRELVAEALRRIEADDPAMNAVVGLRAEEALADAERVDPTGPLAGLPVLVKDLIDVAGMPTTMGSDWLADAPPATADGLVVARLRAAGAIVVGKSNTPAFAHTGFTTNRLFGSTRNPWNRDRSPAGSSGGSAAALAAGMVPLATTSDGGGSVRIPASACGLVGYKPTTGAIGRDVKPAWPSLSTLGATATSVADVTVEASVILGGTPGDPMSIPQGRSTSSPVGPAGSSPPPPSGPTSTPTCAERSTPPVPRSRRPASRWFSAAAWCRPTPRSPGSRSPAPISPTLSSLTATAGRRPRTAWRSCWASARR
ncbi:MAG: amidase [Candidatus Microthrix sp.]|nr:amidase [Candidatus Microthrix sp.]